MNNEYDNVFSVEHTLKRLKNHSKTEQKKEINELLIRNHDNSLPTLNLILESNFSNLIDFEYKEGRAFEFFCINSSKTGYTEKLIRLVNFSKENNKKIPQTSINNALLSLTGDFKNNNNKLPILNLLFDINYFPQKPDISHANYACIENLCIQKETIFKNILELNQIPYSKKILNIFKINKRKDLASALEHFHLASEIKNKSIEKNNKPKI